MSGGGIIEQFRETQIDSTHLTVEATGWAVNEKNFGDKLRVIEVFFDVRKITELEIHPVERPDVSAALHNEAFLYSGWKGNSTFALPTHTEHGVQFIAVFQSGARETLKESKIFNSNMPHPKAIKKIHIFLWDIFLTLLPICFWTTIILFFLWEAKRQFNLKKKNSFLGLIFILSSFVIFFYLTNTLIFVVGSFGHDDSLYVSIAEKISHGKWLGNYTNLTMAKGVGYPLWIAANCKIGMSLAFSQFFYYSLMCLGVVLAFKPIITKNWILMFLFFFLLFNPVTFSMSEMARVLRSGIIPASTLGIIAGGIGMFARKNEKWSIIFPWGLLGGVSFSLFWLTREEGIWILPLVFSLYILSLSVVCYKTKKTLQEKLSRLPVFLLPYGIFLFFSLLVSSLNYVYYDVFSTCELKDNAFNDAYGALLRIEPKERKRFIPVSKEAREIGYTISPSFQEMKPFLEGEIGKRWSNARAFQSKEPAGNGELEGGWFVWALRDAASATGNASTAWNAQNYYQQIADEINGACDKKIIVSIGKRSGFMPVFEKSRIGEIIAEFGVAWSQILSLDGVTYEYPISSGDQRSLKMFSTMTKNHFETPSSDYSINGREKGVILTKLLVLKFFHSIYKFILPIFFLLSLFYYLFSCGYSLFLKKMSFWIFFNGGILCSIGGLCAIVTLIKVEVWGSYGISYLAPAVPCSLLFCFTAWLSNPNCSGKL